MNRLKNKDGSAILWTVLLTVIITILLGSLLTLSYGYHNSTIATVKKQQAYFTARSATDMVIADLGTYGIESNFMPSRNGITLKIDSFGFTSDMGTARAEIKKVSDDTVEVKVISTYADSEYTMTATLKNQSLFFGGIAVKNLEVPVSSTFTLTENTDLYIDNASGFTGRINIGGNLICRGDINLLSGSCVSGTTFEKSTIYDNNLATTYPKKQIWTSEKYIISNYNISVNYPQLVQTTRMLVSSILQGNYDLETCNNVYGNAFNSSLVDTFDMTKYTLTNSSRYVKITNYDYVTGRYYAEQGIADRAHTSVNDWWVWPFKGWKVSDGVYAYDSLSIATYNNFAAVPGWYEYVSFGKVGGVSRYLRNDTYDINQFSFSSSGWFDVKDDVTSVAYILVDENCKVRVKYGLAQDYSGFFGSIQDAMDALNNKKISYLYVYLDDGAILELGNTAGSSAEEIKRLNFYMTIYGTENSTVVLHNNVTVHGSINVGTLTIKSGANVNVNYMTSNGGQVAKQKVDELWTLSNYSD
ncbi:MAG: hypothetical protein EOM05_00180 [Clostridia bacterium]|nr:hypothetical protein [Clostridia bacterium]